jgi:hypothetical protein
VTKDFRRTQGGRLSMLRIVRVFVVLMMTGVLAAIGTGVGIIAVSELPASAVVHQLATQPCRLEDGMRVVCPEGSAHILSIRVGGEFGCVVAYTVEELEFPMNCPSGSTKDAVNPAWRTFYAERTRITSVCPPLWGATDGTASPLFCRQGQPNPAAVRYYRPLGLATLEALGAKATLRDVESGLCSAERKGSIPIALQSYDLAHRVEGWKFEPGQQQLFKVLERC